MLELAVVDEGEAHLTDGDWLPLRPRVPSGAESTTSQQSEGFWASEPSPLGVDPTWHPPQWLTALVSALDTLLRLPTGWSSYRSVPVREEIAIAIIDLLVQVMSDDSPPPAVVPTAHGGIQVEWHRNGIDLEIEALSPYRFVAYFEDARAEHVEELTVISDLSPLVRWISLVSG